MPAGPSKWLWRFFYSRGMIYTHIAPWGASINATYTIKVLVTFLEHFKKKMPTMAQQQWWFHWDNAPVHTATSLKEWMAVKGIQVLEHPSICQILHRPTSSSSGE
jgi:hypothetical protein